MGEVSGRGLGGMGGHVGTECSDPEIGAVVHKSEVLQSKTDVSHESVVHASAVYKCRAGLPLRPGDEFSRLTCGIEHERSRSREHVGPHPGNVDGKVDDQRSGHLMHVGLDAEVSAGSEILLRGAVVAVAGLRTEPAVEMKAVVHEQAACVRGMLKCSVLLCILRKKPGPLHTD